MREHGELLGGTANADTVPGERAEVFHQGAEAVDGAVVVGSLGLIFPRRGDRTRGRGDDGAALAYGLLMRHVRMIRENRGIPQIIFSQDFYAGRPDRRARVYQGIRSYLSDVARIIRQGQEGRQIDREIDPETAAVMFLGLIQPSAILWHMSDGEFDVTRQAQRAWPLFLKAIQDGAASPPEKAGKGQEGERK